MTAFNNASPSSHITPPRINPNPYRWVILVILWLLYTTFGMVARAIFPLITPIINDLQLWYSQMGIILGELATDLHSGGDGSRFRFGSLGCAQIHSRRCSHYRTFGRPALFFASDFSIILIAVALFGVGGPMISIGGPKTIYELFQGKSRGTAIGIYTTGPWIGDLFALAMTHSWVMPLVGHSWRWAFVC